MKKTKSYKAYFFAALVGFVALPLFSLFAYSLMTSLFYRVGSNVAVAVLEGELWGKSLRAFSLFMTPVFILLCFLVEQITFKHRQHIADSKEVPELLSSQQKRELYLQQRQAKSTSLNKTPWFHYFFLFGISILFFIFGVIRPQLLAQISVLQEDVQIYRAEKQLSYKGPLLIVERPIVNGFSAIPDKRFIYYKSDVGSLRCAAPLLKQSQLMQLAYEVTYLPNTGTVLSICDASGNMRTDGIDISIAVPDGYWLYGDLLVPICDDADGYNTLSFEEQKLFDLLYAQVFNSKTGEVEAPTRSFYLPYPLKKERFKVVLALYMASDSFQAYPMYHYRSDDTGIAKVAYCQRVTARK